MTRRTLFAVLIAAAGVTAIAPDAGAAPPKASEKAATDVRARELFQKGDKDYAEGRYEEAYAAFQEAYDISGRSQLLFNISNALERLGRYPEAIDALDKYLASGKAKDKDVVQKRLANLQKRVEEQKKLDERAKEDEDRKRADEKRAADAAAASASKDPVPAPPPPKPTRILPIVLLGAGGAALVTAGIFGVLTLGARSDAEAACKTGPSGRLCSGDASSAIDQDKTFGLVTDIALVSGLVLGGVGTYFLLTGKKDADVANPGVRVGVRPGPGGAVLVGSF